MQIEVAGKEVVRVGGCVRRNRNRVTTKRGLNNSPGSARQRPLSLLSALEIMPGKAME